MFHSLLFDPIEHFHITSRQPCWCPKLILWELHSIFMQIASFVPVNQYGWKSHEWKHPIYKLWLISYFLWGVNCNRELLCQLNVLPKTTRISHIYTVIQLTRNNLNPKWRCFLFTNIDVKFLLIFKFASHRTMACIVSTAIINLWLAH